jgi:hypothetical protein
MKTLHIHQTTFLHQVPVKLTLLRLQLKGCNIENRGSLHSRIIHYNQEPIKVVSCEYELSMLQTLRLQKHAASHPPSSSTLQGPLMLSPRGARLGVSICTLLVGGVRGAEGRRKTKKLESCAWCGCALGQETNNIVLPRLTKPLTGLKTELHTKKGTFLILSSTPGIGDSMNLHSKTFSNTAWIAKAP